VKRGGGAHLTKPGWSKPHTHPHPTILALFGHKITLYRLNQGAHTLAGGLKSEQGLSPPSPLTLTTAVKAFPPMCTDERLVALQCNSLLQWYLAVAAAERASLERPDVWRQTSSSVISRSRPSALQ